MILIISFPADEHFRSVASHLSKQGRDYCLVDLSSFPMATTLSAEYLSQGPEELTLCLSGDMQIPLKEVQSVWWRRPQPFRFPQMSPAHLRFAASESASGFQGLWQCMNAVWVNNPVYDAAATHKLWQLKVAREAGLKIPATLITNNPLRAAEFWERH